MPENLSDETVDHLPLGSRVRGKTDIPTSVRAWDVAGSTHPTRAAVIWGRRGGQSRGFWCCRRSFFLQNQT